MGTISIKETSFREDGEPMVSRRSGELIHNGPNSLILVSGGGRGLIKWYDCLGKGTYVIQEHQYQIELRYGVRGHYTYQVHSDESLVYEGLIKEEQESTLPLAQNSQELINFPA